VKLTSTARFNTICIHAGQEPDPSTGAIITPIYQTSTYVQPELGRHKGYEYARTQNPTRSALEANLAALEAGRAAFAYASGMAAITAIVSELRSGDHVVVTENTYGGTFRLFHRCSSDTRLRSATWTRPTSTWRRGHFVRKRSSCSSRHRRIR
jgi:cystathionine beta-lyase/cystathionine gamma-synthase